MGERHDQGHGVFFAFTEGVRGYQRLLGAPPRSSSKAISLADGNVSTQVHDRHPVDPHSPGLNASNFSWKCEIAEAYTRIIVSCGSRRSAAYGGITVEFHTAYDLLQMAFWLVAILGGGFAIWKHFAESSERRTWERAKLAKQMLDDLDANPKALAASYMLGAWIGRRFTRDEKDATESFEVTEEQLVAILNIDRIPKTLNEVYVRDCFDNLLYHFEQCVSAAERSLVDWADLRPMLATLLAGTQRTTIRALVLYAEYLCYFKIATRLEELFEAIYSARAEVRNMRSVHAP
jgi:hypothetical protein